MKKIKRFKDHDLMEIGVVDIKELMQMFNELADRVEELERRLGEE